MNRIIPLLVGAMAMLIPLTSLAQVPNEGLANGIVAARQKNAALLRQYAWNCRTDIEKDEKMQDIRIDLVSFGPDGQLQRSLQNDQPGQLPGGFFRKRIAEDKRKELEAYVKGLAHLVEEYTLPGGGKVVAFLAQSQVQPITTPEGKTVLQVTGSSVVQDGDTFTMTVDGTTLLPISTQITTTFKEDQVTVSGTFKMNSARLNHLQYATVTVPSKNLTVNIHNYDYVLNN